jgi:hypothetical protein
VASDAAGQIGSQSMREHTEERLEQEWNELYQRLKVILQACGKDARSDGDYFLVDEFFGNYIHQVEMHQLHMLRPEIIKALQEALVGYPDWELELSVFIPEAGITIDPGEGLTICEDEIIDALDRSLLPAEYQGLVYEGSRPPKRPDDILIAGLINKSEE